MKGRKNLILGSLLIAYILFLLYFAVISREPADNYAARLKVFWGYFHPSGNGYRDVWLNLLCYIPIGVLVSLIVKEYKIGKAMLVGIFISMIIEFSQLIWKRGYFDVDDLLNNVVGAFIGALLVVLAMRIQKKASQS